MWRCLVCLEGFKRYVILCEVLNLPSPLNNIAQFVVKTARAVR